MFNALRMAALTAALAAASTGAFASTNGTAVYGKAVASANAQRTVTLTAATAGVNVDNGDTVEFKTASGERFTWHFDTLTGESAFHLAKIAPAGSVDPKVVVYVGANPLYR
ncbi:CzcE family metal-binding protein [Pseudoduganella aquatica]|uniref:CzcE family metal-binding protein n=1 Tax=Pseudoduganella aquatica TaxID=2660641 RepID=A0A7X4KQ83_9BURK|nr:CzcE family metal-binding protein [Pseudoduganella aquatica]MYN10660.1 CzcE family metal-binding protein [Pseudoduganella aquatica]